MENIDVIIFQKVKKSVNVYLRSLKKNYVNKGGDGIEDQRKSLNFSYLCCTFFATYWFYLQSKHFIQEDRIQHRAYLNKGKV